MKTDKILSVTLGIMVAFCLFYLLIIDKTDKYHGPNSKDVKYKVHEKNDKCYIFEPVVYLCG
jgi:hypothetical protein